MRGNPEAPQTHIQAERALGLDVCFFDKQKQQRRWPEGHALWAGRAELTSGPPATRGGRRGQTRALGATAFLPRPPCCSEALSCFHTTREPATASTSATEHAMPSLLEDAAARLTSR